MPHSPLWLRNKRDTQQTVLTRLMIIKQSLMPTSMCSLVFAPLDITVTLWGWGQ